MHYLFGLAVALINELNAHGRSRRAAELAQKTAVVHTQMVSQFDVRTLDSTADRELALQTFFFCHEAGVDGRGGKAYRDLRFEILAWFDEISRLYLDLDAKRLAAQEYDAHVVEWEDYLELNHIDRRSREGRSVKALHVQLANIKEAILREELAVDMSARAYTAASEACPLR